MSKTARSGRPTDGLKSKPSSEQLLELALEQTTLFVGPDETAWAAIETGEHREVRAIASPLFRQWLTHEFYAATGTAPNSRILDTVLLTLETKARFDGVQDEVFLRTGAKEGAALYLDLTDDRWRAVEITGAGWKIQDRPDIHFQRRRGMLPLPEPVRGGKISQLRPFLNLSSEDDFLLIIAWLLAAMRPSGPYPILALSGEPGASKSTTARLLRSLIDPNAAPLRASPREERDCWIAASNAAILTLDNLSSIPQWLSDTLCRIATGGGFTTRQLHTDGDEVLFDVTRPIILTAVGDVIVNSDLADRSMMIELPVIPDCERRQEQGMHSAFAEARPYILGALLDAVAHGLAQHDEVQLENLPRLADFALWATACEGAYAEPGATMAAYRRNVTDAADTLLDNDPLCTALLSLLDACKGYWRGKPATLLAQLRAWAPEGAVQERNWPRNPQTLSSRLRLTMPSLRKRQILVLRGKSNGERYIELTRGRS